MSYARFIKQFALMFELLLTIESSDIQHESTHQLVHCSGYVVGTTTILNQTLFKLHESLLHLRQSSRTARHDFELLGIHLLFQIEFCWFRHHQMISHLRHSELHHVFAMLSLQMTPHRIRKHVSYFLW